MNPIEHLQTLFDLHGFNREGPAYHFGIEFHSLNRGTLQDLPVQVAELIDLQPDHVLRACGNHLADLRDILSDAPMSFFAHQDLFLEKIAAHIPQEQGRTFGPLQNDIDELR